MLLHWYAQTFAFDPWCFHKPSWTEPVEALASIWCGLPSWLLPESCGEIGGGEDRWQLTHLYVYVRVFVQLRQWICTYIDFYECICMHFCACTMSLTMCLGDDITAYSVKK